jgi:hypothetical protein
VLASSPVFDELLPSELRFATDDFAGLAERLSELARLGPAERSAIGRELRTRVAERHSVERWADGVLAVAAARSRA